MDERLRALERAARSNPGDREAGWALVRALDHASDARAWQERCRLARAGDEQAWRELSPAPRGARRLTPGPTRTLDMSTFSGARTDGRSTVLLVGEPTLHALDARTLERTWSVATYGSDPGAVCGPHMVHAGADGGLTLEVRELTTGALVRAVGLPEGLLARQLTCVADRVAVCCERANGLASHLVVVDLTTAEHTPARDVDVFPTVVRDVWLHAGHPARGSTSARDLATGDVRWTAPGAPLRADARSVFLLAPAGRSLQIDCVDVATGSTAWTHLVAGDATASHALGPDLFVVATTPPAWSKTGRERLDIDAVERSTGEARWSYQEQVGLHAVAAVAVASDVVYVLHGPFVVPDIGARAQPQTLLALDARTGERVDSVTIQAFSTGRVSMLPVEGAVLVLSRRHRSTWVYRFGEE